MAENCCWKNFIGYTGNNDDPLYLLTILFRLFGIPISYDENILWKMYNFMIILGLFISFTGVVISAINKLNEDIFNTTSAILFCLNGFCSYLCLTITVYYTPKQNLIECLKLMAKDQSNPLNITNTYRNNSNNNASNIHDSINLEIIIPETQEYKIHLKQFFYKWLRIASAIGFFSYSGLFLAYGAHGDTHFLDVGNNPGWHVGNIIYVYINVGWLLPMVIIRVGSHFFEKKIYSLIEYLENPGNQSTLSQQSQSSLVRNSIDTKMSCTLPARVLSTIHSLGSNEVITSPSRYQHQTSHLNNSNRTTSFSQLSIRQVMCWYDDLYLLNQTLSNTFSLLIFQSILNLFPIVVFMLQGFILQDLSLQKTIVLFYWVFVNSFILFIITGSAAQIDSLNIRIETALATMPSSLMFSSEESVSSYRLALSKIRSIPFGINFYGLRKRITFQTMWTISSVVVSIFLIMLGYSL